VCVQVRAHGASDSAYASYAAKLHVFYLLQCRQAAAYSLYAATTTFLPSLVVAVVLYYGGTLVLDDEVSISSSCCSNSSSSGSSSIYVCVISCRHTGACR
jgi:ABC-type bacteriocin/lantibiotic exporter with double-glycine peptidase domain